MTDSVLHDLPEPQEDEKVAKIVATRGSNQFDIRVANDESVYLAILPTKFHKLVWVKRGDYVLVQVGQEEGEGDSEENGTKENNNKDGVRHLISHILYKEQVKHLKAKGLWPDEDPEFSKGSGADTEGDDEETEPLEADDGIVYNDYDEDENVDDQLFVNTNRVSRLEIQESSSEDDSSDDE